MVAGPGLLVDPQRPLLPLGRFRQRPVERDEELAAADAEEELLERRVGGPVAGGDGVAEPLGLDLGVAALGEAERAVQLGEAIRGQVLGQAAEEAQPLVGGPGVGRQLGRRTAVEPGAALGIDGGEARAACGFRGW